MNSNSNRKIGNSGEDIAVEYLQKNSYQILERNYYSRFGEIDIIARDNNAIVFIEVKYRNNNAYGSPLDSISSGKIRSICKTALYYLNGRELECRFDVISIIAKEIEHIKNAFEFSL